MPLPSLEGLGLIFRSLRWLWLQLDGPNAQRITRLCIFGMIASFGAMVYFAYATRIELLESNASQTASVNERIARIETLFGQIPEMSFRRDAQIKELGDGITAIETSVKAVWSTLSEQRHKLDDIAQRVSRTEGRVDDLANRMLNVEERRRPPLHETR